MLPRVYLPEFHTGYIVINATPAAQAQAAELTGSVVVVPRFVGQVIVATRYTGQVVVVG